MTVREISCVGYRGFQTEQKLRLAVPNGELGSGLTILVGPNGGGKSTVIECFAKMAKPGEVNFSEGKRNKAAGDRVRMQICWDDLVGVLETLPQAGTPTKWIVNNHKVSHHPACYIVPSRRYFTPFFHTNALTRAHLTNHQADFQQRGTPQEYIVSRLQHIIATKYEAFGELLARIAGKPLDWTMERSEAGQFYIKIRKGRQLDHNSDGLGEGIVSLLFLVDALFEGTNDELVIMDEPELSLHPQIQRRLLREILDYTKTRQLVLATHSAEFVSIEGIVNCGEVARVTESENGSVIHQISGDAREALRKLTEDLHNPHATGYDARACLFAEDGMIITEGQEDVLLLRKISEQLGMNYDLPFWGFGAGGAHKITLVATVLVALGFKRLGALFDADKAGEAEKFCRQFPAVAIWVLPANDIRDKKPVQAVPAKSGILDEKRLLKPEHKERMAKIFAEMNAATSSLAVEDKTVIAKGKSASA